MMAWLLYLAGFCWNFLVIIAGFTVAVAAAVAIVVAIIVDAAHFIIVLNLTAALLVPNSAECGGRQGPHAVVRGWGRYPPEGSWRLQLYKFHHGHLYPYYPGAATLVVRQPAGALHGAARQAGLRQIMLRWVTTPPTSILPLSVSVYFSFIFFSLSLSFSLYVF